MLQLEMDHVQLTYDALSTEAVTDLVSHKSCGAVSLFIGTTRDNFDGKKVIRLEYEAYEPMALKAMKSLCAEIREKWPNVHDIAIYHRLGEVRAREASVVIAVSSPHRGDSLSAVAHGIDRLKASVPVWKKEVYEDGAVWKENKECVRLVTETPKLDKSLVQINASTAEMQERIKRFIERKREQVNLSNIHDYIPAEERYNESDETSARTRAVFIRRKDSKCHLKVHRVNHEWGPQTVRQPAAQAETTAPAALPDGIEERVHDVERFLNIRSVTPDVYKRLKEMEDRIRHLESISPEYAAFWHVGSRGRGVAEIADGPTPLECRYTAEEITRKIEALQQQWRQT